MKKKDSAKLADDYVKSWEIAMDKFTCPYDGCPGKINQIDARAQIQWSRINHESNLDLLPGSWAMWIGEAENYDLICSANPEHIMTYEPDEHPEEFQILLCTGAMPYKPFVVCIRDMLKRKNCDINLHRYFQ